MLPICALSPWTISVAALVLLAPAAKAELLTFDNLPDVTHQGTMPNGYGGLDWTDFYYVDGLKNDYNPSGYSVGTISDRNVIFNGHGTSASFSSANPFTLTSLYVTAAWRDGLKVTITGCGRRPPRPVGGGKWLSQTYQRRCDVPGDTPEPGMARSTK